MNDEEKANSLEPEDTPSTGTGSKLEETKLLEGGPGDTNPAAPIAIETSQPIKAMEEQVDAEGSSSSSVEPAPRTAEAVPPIAVEPVFMKKHQSFFEEQPAPVIEIAPRVLCYRTRRDFLLLGTGAMVALAGGGFLLPWDTLRRMGVRRTVNSPAKEWFLNRALRIDDDVAEALYSGNPDPYFMSIDLATARHPQTLLATHFNGQPLTVEHGAPLRLLVPVKLGLKNVKAITKITYSAEEPRDYWAERGYSRYDGI